MQLSFISILLAFISTVFASPLRILDSNIQAISERGAQILLQIPESVDALPKFVQDPRPLLSLMADRGDQIAGTSTYRTHRLKSKYPDGLQSVAALLKTIKRDPKKVETQRIAFIHEAFYLDQEGILLACAESSMWYFLVIKDNGYLSPEEYVNKYVHLTKMELKNLGGRVRREIERNYGKKFIKWILNSNLLLQKTGEGIYI